MDEGKRPKRVRRSFTDEFKAGAVRLVLDDGKTVCGVARDLDLTASALRAWSSALVPTAATARPGSPAKSGSSSRTSQAGARAADRAGDSGKSGGAFNRS